MNKIQSYTIFFAVFITLSYLDPQKPSLDAQTPTTKNVDAACRTDPTVWIKSASDRAFPSSPPSCGTPNISLFAARNEYQAAQILIWSSTRLTSVAVTPNALIGPGGALIPASNIQATREYVHKMKPDTEMDTSHCRIPGDPEIPPDNSCEYTDGLEDGADLPMVEHTTVPYYYSVYTSPTQIPGVYTGTAFVNTNAGAATVHVSVIVYNVTLPATTASTFKLNNWFTSVGWDYQPVTEGAIPQQYSHAEPYSTNWWTVIGNIATNMAKHRNNVIYTDFQALLIPDTTITGSGIGEYTFGWNTFDRFVQTFIDAGAMQYIYTPTLMEHSGMLETLQNDATGKPSMQYIKWDTPDAERYLNLLFSALKVHLDAKGWTNKFYMSALDEPYESAHIAAAVWFFNIYKSHFPNALTTDAHSIYVTGLESQLSTFTPITASDDIMRPGGYDKYMGYYQRQRISGKELWLYTSSAPQDGYMNRFITYHLVKTRLLPWLVWKVSGTGYLHWGWNVWGGPDNANPLNTYDGTLGTGGDFWLVRPCLQHPTPNLNICDSVRSENQLYGVQDYELLNILKQTKPLTARSITETLITNLTSYTRSGALVDNAHKQILDEIVSTESDTQFAFADNFSSGNDANWKHTSGTWTVANGSSCQAEEYCQTDTAQWAASTIKGRAYSDAVLTFDVAIVNDGGISANWAGAVVRSANGTDIDTGYLIGLRNNGHLFIYRSGATLAQTTSPVPGYVPGHYMTIKVVARGNTIQAFVGNNASTLVSLNANDNGFLVGNIALATASAAKFRNVVVNAEQNFAEGKPVSYSSTFTSGGWSPLAVVDGKTNSTTTSYVSYGWSSDSNASVSHAEWLAIDLGKHYDVSRVDLYPRNDGANTGYGFPVDFTIQTSTDNVHWTTVVTKTNYPRPGNTVQAFPFSRTTARYIKVDGTVLRADNQSSYRMQFAEVRAVGGNFAAGRPVTYSSSYESAAEGWGAMYGTDGARLSTLGYSEGWSSDVSIGHEWITIDLGGNSQISNVKLYPRNDGANTGYGFPVDFTIQVSQDNVNWTPVIGQASYPQPGNAVQSFSFTSMMARYVKIDGTRLRNDGQGNLRMQFAEVAVH